MQAHGGTSGGYNVEGALKFFLGADDGPVIEDPAIEKKSRGGLVYAIDDGMKSKREEKR